MSFGISIGDLLAISKLLRSTISSIHASKNASTQYSDLVLSELGALERVLSEIQDDEAIKASDSVRVAAARCKAIIDDFLVSLKKYRSLREGGSAVTDVGNEQNTKMTQKLFKASRRLQWGFSMEKNIDGFRRKLAPAVMCLHVALTTFQV